MDLRANHPELIEAVLDHASLPYGSECVLESNAPPKAIFHLISPDELGGFRLRRNGRTVFDVSTPKLLGKELHAHLMVAVAEHSPEYLFVHAGVVGWRGRAIVFPGRSFAGKTTLTAELVRAGATYYSDEYALLGRDGLIYPFARDLQMRSPGCSEQWSLSAKELRGTSGKYPIPPRAVLFVAYKAEALWSPEPVKPAISAMEMMLHAPAIRRIPARAMQVLSSVTRSAPTFRSHRGEAALTAALILNQFC